MTVGDVERLRSGARDITAATSDDVLADIDTLRAQQEKPAWVRQAKSALEMRYDPMRTALPPAPVLEGFPGVVPPGIDADGGFAASGGAGIGVDETIVFAVGTPVFLVKNNAVDIDSARDEAKAWRTILTANAAAVNRTMVSVGRIDVDNFGTEYLGTAWVIDDGLVVTNRHVANYFAQASGTDFAFRLGFDARNPVGVEVDFLEEFGSTVTDEVSVERVVWIAPDSAPDIAFLKLADPRGAVGRVKLNLSTEAPRPKLPVAVVGYPARDFQFSDQSLAEKVFGGVFDKKRLAVGNLLAASTDLVKHSCCTLGGNSGSPVVDIGTGAVVGLHYRGLEFVENHAVPAAAINKYLRIAGGLTHPSNPESVPMPTDNGNARNLGGSVSFTVPLRITVEVDVNGLQQVTDLAAASRPNAPTTGPVSIVPSPSDEQVLEAVRQARTTFANRADVVAVKPGYRFVDGAITDERAVVVAVKNKLDLATLASRGIAAFPDSVNGVRIDIAVASTADLVVDFADEAARVPRTSYKPRPDLPLERRHAEMGFVIHSSPDSGWPQLREYLKGTRKSLTIGMYDFGARNVVAGVLDAVKATKETIAMVLQVGGKVHTEDMSDAEAVDMIREAKGSKFTFAPASVGKNGIFDSAYHIKVAVRDSASVWLSSGNWQISNQPNIDPVHNPADKSGALNKYNREWHAILHDEVLAKLFEAHLLRDLEEASAVDEAATVEELFVYVPTGINAGDLEAARTPPVYFEALVGKRVVDVQPILTPDNYTDEVVKFIRSAKRSIHFQNQSFNTRVVGDNYRRLLTALLDQQKAGLDVKIIFRSFDPGDDRDVVTNARTFGFQDVASTIRSQRNCHTKGIIVDGEAVLLGSHNWTTAGTGFNRDASLIFFDHDIAQFYEKLFDFDWKRIGPMKIDESVPAPTLAQSNAAMPGPGLVAVPVSTILGRTVG